eukprot:4175820-Pleurochrysis_carterae.AAC.1
MSQHRARKPRLRLTRGTLWQAPRVGEGSNAVGGRKRRHRPRATGSDIMQGGVAGKWRLLVFPTCLLTKAVCVSREGNASGKEKEGKRTGT